MAIRVRWCAEETGVLCWTFVGRWTWSHLQQAIDETCALGTVHAGRVDLLIDVREMGLPPFNLTGGLKAIADNDFGFRADGINVLIGMDSYLRTLWDVLEKQLPVSWQVHYAETREEARAIIQKYRTDN